MKLNCPICNEHLNESLSCINEHQFQIEEGVIKLMTPEFVEMLDSWLISFEDFRKPHLQELDFNHLPSSGLKVNSHLWKAREQDLSIISSFIASSDQKALDIGSWNGWLANHLTQKGLAVTAIDYFTHELDGLKAKKFYQHPHWNSIQMDLEDLSILNEPYDLIVINRCLAYFTNIEQLIDTAIHMLTPGGKLMVTGINVVDKKNGEAEELKKAKIDFKKRYDQEVFFKPTKGYLDQHDLEVLESKKIQLILYPNFKNFIKKKWLGKNDVTYYGVYKNE